MTTSAFQVTAIKNCRNYTKKCYNLTQSIDNKLVESLEIYGFLEVIDFSSFTKLAKPCFKIKLLNELEINGVLHGKQLFVVIAKRANHNLFSDIEAIICQWHKITTH